jgi:hypothetical protein
VGGSKFLGLSWDKIGCNRVQPDSVSILRRRGIQYLLRYIDILRHYRDGSDQLIDLFSSFGLHTWDEMTIDIQRIGALRMAYTGVWILLSEKMIAGYAKATWLKIWLFFAIWLSTCSNMKIHQSWSQSQTP